MEESIMEKETVSTVEKNVLAYFDKHDVQYLTEDAVFTNLSTGDEARGREGIKNFLNFMYHIAFDAKAEVTHKLFTETNAVLEFNFKGKHIGEFAGLQPTNKEINVPVCVCYDIENGLIKTGRIYLLTAVLMQQLQG